MSKRSTSRRPASVSKKSVAKKPVALAVKAAVLTSKPAAATKKAAACSRCGRVNTHGTDCRNTDACAGRRKANAK